MFFAQVGPDVIGWVTAAINLGALGILGFYFLRVEPAIRRADHIARMDELRLISSVFRENAEGFDQVSDKLTAEIEKLRQQGACKYQP